MPRTKTFSIRITEAQNTILQECLESWDMNICDSIKSSKSLIKTQTEEGTEPTAKQLTELAEYEAEFNSGKNLYLNLTKAFNKATGKFYACQLIDQAKGVTTANIRPEYRTIKDIKFLAAMQKSNSA